MKLTPSTDGLRDYFRFDDIRIENGTIQIYYHNSQGKIWSSCDGGPIYGDLALERTKRRFIRIANNRELLPYGYKDMPIVIGEVGSDGKFTEKELR